MNLVALIGREYAWFESRRRRVRKALEMKGAELGPRLPKLSDEQAVAVLRAMDRVARRGVIAADLLRTRRAYAWITLLTLGANPMVRHDARVSVAQAFNKDEARELARLAGLGYLKFYHHFAHRFVLAGSKPSR